MQFVGPEGDVLNGTFDESAWGLGTHPGRVLILIPLFNDWESFAELAPKLDDALAENGLAADILVVDDGSIVEPGEALRDLAFRAIGRVDVLALRCNLGHQRAIAVGLAYIEDRYDCGAVVVMDGDGEDAPADVPRLLARLREEGGRKIVFAERAKRSEAVREHRGETPAARPETALPDGPD